MVISSAACGGMCLGGALLALAIGAAGPARALGGPAAEGGGGLEASVVMVLGSRGNACTGTVVAPAVVLTAAHCVSGAPRFAVAYHEGASPVLQEVAEVVRHPEFRPNTRVSIDLALVRLRLPLPGRFAPAPLDAEAGDDRVGSTLTMAGFGLAREDDEASAGVLRRAAATVLPRELPRYLRLGRADGELAVCRGDSGGPVLDGAGRVAGVLYGKEHADGRACGQVAQAVRVAPQRPWIDGVLRRWRG